MKKVLFQLTCGLLLAQTPAASATTLAGQVTAPGGTRLANIPIQVLHLSATSGHLVKLKSKSTITDILGNFVTGDLDPDNYWLRAHNSTTDVNGITFPTGYEGLYYHPGGNQPFRDPASPIVVDGVAPSIGGFNFQLRPAFPVSGTVTAPGPPDYSKVDFDVYDAVTGDFLPLINTKAVLNTTPPALTGNYVLYGLPNGSYDIACDPAASLGLYPVYQGNVFLKANATPIQVAGAGVFLHFLLAPGFTMQGTVSDAGGPRANIDMDLYQVTAGGDVFVPDSASTGTNPPGTYTSGVLMPATYLLRADPDPATLRVTTYYSTNPAPATFAEEASPVALSANRTGLDITVPTGGLITGTIQDTNGAGLAQIDLDVFDSTLRRMEVDAKSGVGGAYSIGAVVPGLYTIRADPAGTQAYARTYYTNNLFNGDAVPVTVTAGAPTPGIDFTLPGGGFLSGQILDATSGAAIAGVDLDLFDAQGARMEANASSDATGHYTLGAVPAGSYTVAADPGTPLGYIKTYYTNAFFKEEATPATVVVGQTTASLNIPLLHGGFIAGTIATTNDLPLTGIDIDVFDGSGRRMEANAVTDTNGAYLIGALPAGNFTLRADPTLAQGFVRTYYTNAFFKEQGVPIGVLGEQTTSQVDIRLQPGGFLAGRLSQSNGAAAAGIDFDIFDASARLVEVNASSDTNGQFVIGPLPAGSYTFRADPLALQYLARTYYPGTFSSISAQVVTVAGTLTNSPLDLTLVAAGAIAGLITDLTNAPLATIDLDAFVQATGARADADAQSTTGGTYLLGPLVPGSYVVRADPDALHPYVREYWQEAARMTQATAVAVSANQLTTNINMTLQPGSTVAGKITDLQSNALDMVDLDIFPAGGGAQALEQTALSATDGTYRLGPVPVGSWAVRANPSLAQGYETRYYPAAGNITNAQPVLVVASQPVTGIDFSLGSNLPPQAVLAPFAGIPTNQVFLLDGSGSTDGNNDRLLYTWRQVGGPTVAISDTNAPAPLVTLPPGAATGTLFQFELVTRDFVTTSTVLHVDVVNGPPQFRDVTLANGAVSVLWTLGIPAQPYTLQQSADFAAWSNLVSGNMFSHPLPLVSPRQTLRIQADP